MQCCCVLQQRGATDYNVGTDSELRAAIQNNANITLTADIPLSNSTLEIPKNNTVTIDLNGHTLDRNLTKRGESGGTVITVRSGATLNLKGGTVKGGWGGNDGQSKRYKRRPHIYLFRPEDLDNDDVISAVEQTPTYKRTREILDSIYQQASGEDVQQRQDTPPADVVQGTIKFVM